VIGQTSNASLLHLREEIGTVSLSIKHHRKAVQKTIGVELLGAWLVGYVLLETRHDIAFEDLQQSRINGLAHHEEGFAVHGIDPIVDAGTEA
jgi:hypothetical protein